MKELPQAFAPDQVAVVTGAASGIGLAAARRPALSRWHPDYEAKFARFIAGS